MRELDGCTILYTREKAQYLSFRQQITELGGNTLHLPLMSTHRLPLSADEQHHLSHCDTLIFTSANAVHHLLSQYTPANQQQSIAIGIKTAKALPFPPMLTAPPPYNSEALLKIWQPKNKNIALIGAAGGRKILKKTLMKHNSVHEIYSYQRNNPSLYWPSELPHIDIITIASCQTLENLRAIIPQEKLKLLQYQVCIAAISERVARYAKKQGFQHSIFAEEATEIRQITSICRWWKLNQEHLHD
ncbi:MAG: uroporphyrinogen-III synthase [Cardiobacteriaceae bacterium]|nr:uroporphyrinogen-III synthase [Cardiobacteriaceae bacterium]